MAPNAMVKDYPSIEECGENTVTGSRVEVQGIPTQNGQKYISRVSWSKDTEAGLRTLRAWPSYDIQGHHVFGSMVEDFASVWRDATYGELREACNVPEGWDGRGCPRPHREIVDEAYKMAELIHQHLPDDLPVPDIYPMPTGSIQFEWTVRDRLLELEIIDPDTIMYLRRGPGLGEKGMEAKKYPVREVQKTLDLIGWLTGV